jgi:hypothetical protein
LFFRYKNTTIQRVITRFCRGAGVKTGSGKLLKRPAGKGIRKQFPLEKGDFLGILPGKTPKTGVFSPK